MFFYIQLLIKKFRSVEFIHTNSHLLDSKKDQLKDKIPSLIEKFGPDWLYHLRLHQAADLALRQLEATLQADGKEQVDGQGVVQPAAQLEVGTESPPDDAEHKEGDDGIDAHGSAGPIAPAAWRW